MRVAVLVSGSGTNLQALLDAAAADSDFGAEIDVVISDRPGVPALRRAGDAGIPVEIVSWSDYQDRDAFSAAVCDAAERHGAEALVLAGFMRILAPVAVGRFPNRIVNIHPALLPAFPGARPVAEALEHGVKVTGVTVHFVDEDVDNGPIIAQVPVDVMPGDDEAALRDRVHAVEHAIFPRVVKALAAGRLTVDGRHVTWIEPS